MQTILITGSTDGIGKQTALELADLGHQIIIHGRNEERCLRTLDEIQNKTNNRNLDFVVADFSEFEPINEMVKTLNSKFDKIDVLINNAGVFLNQRKTNSKVIELTFMINHLAHFYLTYLIFDLLKNSDDPRIINVSSIAHESADFNNHDFQLKKNYSGYSAYANSKLFNLWFTYALHRRLKNSKFKVFALHPGVISTKLLYAGFRIQGSPLNVGAETPVYLAVSNNLNDLNGKYFIKKKPQKSSKLSYDENLQEIFWDYSIELCGLEKEEVERKFSNHSN
ncbi:MAG: SDR family oxidoreductase [Ignavibacteria bacterium]|nr:SDR family oxidoreductase [Ignavibacteria bacterium]